MHCYHDNPETAMEVPRQISLQKNLQGDCGRLTTSGFYSCGSPGGARTRSMTDDNKVLEPSCPIQDASNRQMVLGHSPLAWHAFDVLAKGKEWGFSKPNISFPFSFHFSLACTATEGSLRIILSPPSSFIGISLSVVGPTTDEAGELQKDWRNCLTASGETGIWPEAFWYQN